MNNQALKNTLNEMEEGINRILNAYTLVSAKEIAAELLDLDVEDYIIQEVDEIMDEGYNGDPQEELDFANSASASDIMNKWE